MYLLPLRMALAEPTLYVALVNSHARVKIGLLVLSVVVVLQDD